MNNFFSFRSDTKLTIKVKEPEVEMSIIKRLGKPKFWVSNNDFNFVMERMYKISSKNVRSICLDKQG
ncbi:MAG: hypothetical protein ABIB71_02190 [Candidatus Woesearchaeota archaeon]